ncbi:MAG: 2Fe-2S iron-sulfur cluster binding domain-containing protein [Proteobacteria bacterium]|nr:2Fe-2S iron-sulfur cluster binding domain-containing protein [Pseudomonadota bacterium]
MSFQVTIEPLGATIDVADGQTILDAALRAGIWLPYACNHGLCGTCKVDVIEGEVDHQHASAFALMDVERAEHKTLACCATLQSDVVIEADVDEEIDAEQIAVEDFTATVARMEMLTPTIKGLWLEVAGDGVAFQAGQYLNLFIPGLEQPRAFSIASAPTEPQLIELNIRLVEGGAATGYIHNELKLGDSLSFTAPLGRFFVRKSAPEPIIFCAGGSGLSSPKSMILDLLESGDKRAICLIYGARNVSELYYADLFNRLAEEHPNFTYCAALSESSDESPWAGFRGFVNELANERFGGRFSGYKAYLCGPPPMIDACISTLMQGRLFEEHIFMESFLTAADGVEPARRSALFKKF